MAKKARRQDSLATIIKTAQYAIDQKLANEIPKVLDYLLDTVKDSTAYSKDRITAAKFLLEYFMPKKTAPLVQVNQQIAQIKHISHLGLPTGEAQIPTDLPTPPPRQLIDTSQVDAADMIPEEHDRFEPVPGDELPPRDVSMVKIANDPLEAPTDVAPLLSRDQPRWRKGFW